MTIIDTTKDLAALFSKQVNATPDLPALEDEHSQYTYAELDAKVQQLTKILRSHGVGRDSLVGILLPRSADYVIACLAALRAGGAFLVLEVAYPPDLLQSVLEDASPAVVLSYKSKAARIGKQYQFIALDAPLETGQVDPGPLPSSEDLDKLAFVSYSSGTTGKPKGIANPHSAPVLSYDLRFQLRDVQPGERVACNVFFIWEIIRPLLRGATVVTVPDEASYDPIALADLLATRKCTETLMTPTLLAAVLSRATDLEDKLKGIKTLWLNGEVVTTDLARRAIKVLPNVQLYNCYSASETHEIACGNIKEILPMLPEDAIYCPVGPPMDSATIYVLDEDGKRLENGRSGELFVGGPLLARGYLNRPETTAKAFVPDTFSSVPGSRMYRTGDIAQILPSGLLEIVGRVGSMIKLRGYSVVPGKVESTIIANLAVAHCAVVPHGDGLERQLIAYVVPDNDVSADRPAVEIDVLNFSPQSRRVLEEHLAQYMIPALWIKLDELPTHAVSGKIDKRALPAPIQREQSIPLTNGVKSASANGADLDAITKLWSKSLNVPQQVITSKYTFFDLGGHSLTLADLASRMSAHFEISIPAARLADPASLDGHLKVVESILSGQAAEPSEDLDSMLKRDVVLDEDIIPTKDTAFCAIRDAKSILLTGVTGFLGAFVLQELCATTDATVICLVRSKNGGASSKAAVIAKIRSHLLEMGIWTDSMAQRIEVVNGNLSTAKFGLSCDDFDQLVRRVDVIIHVAAAVNLVYPYAAIRKANVEGTREVLRLAAASGATLQYISTNGVLPPSGEQGWSEASMVKLEDVPKILDSGYGQTKWVAEQLVLEAISRGISAKVLRVGTIGGHSQLGSNNAWDLLSALVIESIQLGKAPDVTGWRYEMTPVDFVSRSIVQLANIGGSTQRVYHIGDAHPVAMTKIFDMFAQLGYLTQPVSWDQWVAAWNDKRRISKSEGDPFNTVDVLRAGMPDVGFLRDIIVLDTGITKKLLPEQQQQTVDTELMRTYARHWFARGWINTPPMPTGVGNGNASQSQVGSLSGKVAVVIGASSGIGAAVARALAQTGCSVALAARRTYALKTLSAELEGFGIKSLPQETDITSREQVTALIETTSRELGQVDILVNCAGVMYFTMMKNASTEDWERTVDVNCKGLLNCLAATVPAMLARGSGHILAISSDAGRRVFAGLGVYSASKFFTEATLQSLRLETVGSGLRVTSLQPGNVSTDLLSMSTDAEALEKYGTPSGAKVLSGDDVARAVIYALTQPEHVSVNEILIEPRDEPI